MNLLIINKGLLEGIFSESRDHNIIYDNDSETIYLESAIQIRNYRKIGIQDITTVCSFENYINIKIDTPDAIRDIKKSVCKIILFVDSICDYDIEIKYVREKNSTTLSIPMNGFANINTELSSIILRIKEFIKNINTIHIRAL